MRPFSMLLILSGCLDLGPVDDQNWKVGSHVNDWRDEVIYQLVVDRFADGDLNNDDKIDPTALGRYQGGDWQGVIDHLDYLQHLGVTALWISPVVRNVDTDANVDGYHGYWAQDFTLTNPHMGDLAKLRELVGKAHARGFKVILDIVTNHIGQLFFYDINGNGSPDENVYGSGDKSMITRVTEYDPDFDPAGVQAHTSLGYSGPAKIRWLYIPEIHRMPPVPVDFQNPDWYNKKGRIIDYTVREQVLTGDFPGGLKDLKTLNPDVQKALTDVFVQWIKAADFDAFRIDTLKHVEHEFWQYFCPHVRSACKAIGKNNFLMFGEAFDGDDQLVGSYTFNDELDSTFFFPQKFSVIDRVIKYNQEGTQAIENQFKALQTLYSSTPHTDGPTAADGTPLATPQLMVNFLDNHDIPRFLYDKNSIPALHQALGFLFSEPGIPCVYYGTEQQFSGGNDPANRERLWDTGFVETGATYRWVKQLSDLRRAFRPLRHGNLQVRWSTPRKGAESDAGIFAFERVDPSDGKIALVVMNVNEAHASSTQAPGGGAGMKVGFSPGTALVNVLGPTQAAQVAADGTLVVTVPARTQNTDGSTEPGIRVFVAQSDQGGIP